MILLLDNYDSFVFNLDRYFRRLGHETLVVRSDAMSVEAIERLHAQAIIISPGPKAPDDAGCSMEVIRRIGPKTPILGVCLGHQAIGQAFGGKIVRAKTPVHGMASNIRHSGQMLFEGIPSPCSVARYHSLIIHSQSMPDCLIPTAWSEADEIMAIQHRELPIFGVQFHPESILTDIGYQLLANFLKACRLEHSEIPQNDYQL